MEKVGSMKRRLDELPEEDWALDPETGVIYPVEPEPAEVEPIADRPRPRPAPIRLAPQTFD